MRANPAIVALLSQHGKEQVLAPALQRAGYAIEVVQGFDTDTLGTFTGDIERKDTQANTALHKARLATSLSGRRYGLGSEGAFAPDPYVGMGPWNTEILAWWDKEADYGIVVGTGTPKTNYAQTRANSIEAVISFVAKAGFPEHGLILGRPGDPMFQKGITDHDRLFEHCKTAIEKRGEVWLETDMRAHLNPTRMQVIAELAEDLVTRLQTHCPACKQPGFGPYQPIPGALCESCNFPTRENKGEIWRCLACARQEVKLFKDKRANPQHCPQCNP